MKPTDWHRFEGDGKTCSLCGAPAALVGRVRKRHRAPLGGRGWQKQTKSPAGWIIEPVGVPAKRRHRSATPKRKRRSAGPKPKTVVRITQAATMYAHGKTNREIGEALGVREDRISEWKQSYASVWEPAFEAAIDSAVEPVRAAAGSDAVLDNPSGYCVVAERAEKWLQTQGVEVFTENESDDGITLTGFYHEYYLPLRLADAAENTRRLFCIVLKRWRLLTADPPISQITSLLLAKFRDALTKSRGQKPGSRMSPVTVGTMLRGVQTLLDMAGPPGPGRRDAVGLLPAPVPWVKPPRAPLKMPRVVPWERIQAAYQAAGTMTWPDVPGVEPAAWWQALLVVCLYTGLRRRTLFELELQDIDWAGRRLVVPAERLKSGRDHIVPLHDVAFSHLERIRTDRQLVFVCCKYKRWFYHRLHTLEEAAGISRGDFFGLHDLRRTLATTLWEDNPAAAQLMLGHTKADVTREHYVSAPGIIERALRSLPTPEAFKQNGNGNGNGNHNHG